jgi:ankyrin repeat protein
MILIMKRSTTSVITICLLGVAVTGSASVDGKHAHAHTPTLETPAAYRQEFARLAIELKGDRSWQALDRLRSLRLTLGPSWYKDFPSLRTALAASLTSAAARGHSVLVGDAIASGAAVDVSTFGYTPLFWAAYRLDLKMTKVLLEAGADANTPNKHKVTPIVEPVWQDDLDLVRLLVAGGARVNVPGKSGAPLVFDAVKRGSTEMLDLLVAAGADLNAGLGADGAPILWQPVKDGKIEVVQALIDAGADVNAIFEGRTIAWHARKLAQKDIYKRLRTAGGKR